MQEQPADSSKQLSETDWEQTLDSTKRLVKSLVERVEQLERQHEELKAEHQLLREQLQQNSTNSSKPPSQDTAKEFKAKERPKRGKTGGAFLFGFVHILLLFSFKFPVGDSYGGFTSSFLDKPGLDLLE